MPVSTYRVEAISEVEIVVNDPDVLDRINDPEFRHAAYTFRDEEHALQHIAFNAVANGVTQINRLDGWADMADDAVTITVDTHTLELES